MKTLLFQISGLISVKKSTIGMVGGGLWEFYSMVVDLVVMLDYLAVAMAYLAALITAHYGPAKIFKQAGLDRISTAFYSLVLITS